MNSRHPQDPKDLPWRELRFRAGLPALLHDGDDTYPCVAADLSLSGALLAAPRRLGDGRHVRLHLRSHAGDLCFETRAQVTRRNASGQENWRQLALRFFAPQLERRLLEKLLARLDHDDGSATPLSQRLVMARRATTSQREILWQDDHPRVLEALVRNRETRPTEIVTLVRRQNLSPSTLEVIARDPRFSNVEAVTTRLLDHPGTSRRLALRVAAGLSARARRRS